LGLPLVPLNAAVTGDPEAPVYATLIVPLSIVPGVPVGVNPTVYVQDVLVANVEPQVVLIVLQLAVYVGVTPEIKLPLELFKVIT